MPTCKDYGQWVPTTSGLNKHITWSQTCHQKWLEWLQDFSVNVFDLGGGFQPEVHGYSSEDGLEEHDFTNEFDIPPEEPDLPHITIEEVPDEDEPGQRVRSDNAHWIETYPAEALAGIPVMNQKNMLTKLHKIQAELENSGKGMWGHFQGEDEWELAKWLI
ncbi:hypothetical protein BDR07DRAFT_1479352 [Suillus spraguei]|nr:hypothetical protein BDR07DRAFT_1479352 [Suillus spraguei]